MYFCYLDEAGCTGALPHSNSPVQPVFVLCGLIIPEASIRGITQDFLSLKRQFNPALAESLEYPLDIVKHEIKGAEDLRKPIRKKNRNNKRRAIGFLDKYLTLLEQHGCRILPRIHIKAPATPIDSVALYARSIQRINQSFQAYLTERDSQGIMIADSRNYDLNIKVSHSIFTQKFKATGDAYPNVIEMPLYGHSDNHVGLQLTDILCSALLFPIATLAYCSGYVNSVHVSPKFEALQTRYAERLKDLSFRYQDGERYRGGITVYDNIAQRSPNHFFQWETTE